MKLPEKLGTREERVVYRATDGSLHEDPSEAARSSMIVARAKCKRAIEVLLRRGDEDDVRTISELATLISNSSAVFLEYIRELREVEELCEKYLEEAEEEDR